MEREGGVPQLWLTYQEISEALGVGVDDARLVSIGRGWKRKRSRDGLARAQLPADLALAFFEAVVARHHAGDRSAGGTIGRLEGALDPLRDAPAPERDRRRAA